MNESRAAAFIKAYHPKTREDDFRTPDFILNYIESRWGVEITHDGACSLENAKRKPLDIFSDNPIPDGSVVFINPPWTSSAVVKFVEAAYLRITENPTVKFVFLLPNKLTEVMWVESINDKFSHITFLGGRLDFSGPHSVKGGASRWGCFIGWIGDGVTSMDSARIKNLKELFG